MEFTTFDLLANESRLEDQGEVEATELEPAEIGENRAIEVNKRRGRPKLVRTSEKRRPRKVYPAQYVQPEEEGGVHREEEEEEEEDEEHRNESDEEHHETNLVVDELIGPTQKWKEAMIAEFESLQGSGYWVQMGFANKIQSRWKRRTKKSTTSCKMLQSTTGYKFSRNFFSSCKTKLYVS